MFPQKKLFFTGLFVSITFFLVLFSFVPHLTKKAQTSSLLDSLPFLPVNNSLPKKLNLSPSHSLYLKKDYTAITHLPFSQKLNRKDQYIYLRALYHTHQYERLLGLVSHSQYLNDEVVASYLVNMYIRALIHLKKYQQAYKVYKKYKNSIAKEDYEVFLNLNAIIAANLNKVSLAFDKGKFYYQRFLIDKKLDTIKHAVLLGNSDAIKELNKRNYNKILNQKQLKKMIPYLDKWNKPLYRYILVKQGRGEQVGKYYFDKRLYSKSLKYFKAGAFYADAARLALGSMNTSLVHKAEKNPTQFSLYLSEYYYRKHSYSKLKNLLKKRYHYLNMRYTIVLGLKYKDFKGLYNLLSWVQNHYISILDEQDTLLLLYWKGYLENKLYHTHKTWIRLSSKYSFSYYGWQAFKALDSKARSQVVKQWSILTKNISSSTKNYLKNVNDISLKKDRVWQRMLLFFSLKENSRGYQQLRIIKDRFKKKGIHYRDYYLAMAKEFYRIWRMDLYYAYTRYFKDEIIQETGVDLVYKNLLHIYFPLIYKDILVKAANYNHLEPAMLASLVLQESSYDFYAVSWVGAQGLSQLMPATAKPILTKLSQRKIIKNRDIFDPRTNLFVGADYLSWLYNRVYHNYSNSFRASLAYASYNAGPRRIKKMYHEFPRYENVSHFIEKIKFLESRNYSKRLILYKDLYQLAYF